MTRLTEGLSRTGRLRLAISVGCLALGLLAVPSASAAPAWLAPDNVSATGQDASEPQVALDAEGNAVAVWRRFDGSNFITQAATRPSGGSWEEADDLSAAGKDTYEPRVALDAEGNAVAIWRRFDGSNFIIQAATRPAGGTWSEPDGLSAEGKPARDPQLAVGPEGSAFAVWRRFDGSNYVAQVAIRPNGGAWSEPDDLSVAGRNAEGPRVAVGSGGDAVAVWWRFNGEDMVVQGSIKPAGGNWSAPDDLSAAGQGATSSSAAVDPEGSAVAVWRRSDGANQVVQAAGYDAAGPQLRGLSVPATGVVGRSLAFTVSPFDVWSPLGATGWSFGDGAIANGTAVSHAYANAGRYTIAVTGSDVLGNATSVSRSISIEPAPAADAPRASVGTAIAAKRARVRRGKALLRLRCRGGGSCQGMVRLVAVLRVRGTAQRKSHRERVRRISIGSARFGVPGGQTRVLAVRLNRKGRRLLRHAGHHKLTVRLGGDGIKRRMLVLKEVRRKRR